MKPPANPPSRFSRGLTRWEILGIIVIIVAFFLATLSFQGHDVTNETKAHAMINGIAIAISGYETEYGHYPNPKNLQGNQKMNTLHDSELIACLMGNNPSNSNPHRIQFYNPPIAKDGKNGYDSKSGDLTDPWGQPLWILMDVANQGYLVNPYYGAAGYPKETESKLKLGCIVWDFGEDKIDGTKRRSTDDLRSWSWR